MTMSATATGLYVIDTGKGLKAELEYNTDLFDEATVVRLWDAYQAVLENAVVHPERRISELLRLSGAERQQILRDWNATGRVVPPAAVHDLFAAQARLTPEAVAVVADDGSLTYGELDRRSNRLASAAGR